MMSTEKIEASQLIESACKYNYRYQQHWMIANTAYWDKANVEVCFCAKIGNHIFYQLWQKTAPGIGMWNEI